MLETSLFEYKLHKKVYISWSFFFCVRVLKPWFVETEIKVSNGFNILIQKDFEDELPYVHISIFGITEFIHIKHLDRRVALDNLPKQTNHRNSSHLSQFWHEL